jgi:hypothetical protein
MAGLRPEVPPPSPYVLSGASLHRELEILVDAGLTPMQALRAATQLAAEWLGLTLALGLALGSQAAARECARETPLPAEVDLRRCPEPGHRYRR